MKIITLFLKNIPCFKSDLNKVFMYMNIIRNLNLKETKKGFSFAETLITLVVIGVVASAIISPLINKTDNEDLRAGLLKAQSILVSALDLYHENWYKISNSDDMYYIMRQYFAIAEDCSADRCVPSSSNHYKTFNNGDYIVGNIFNDDQFVLNNGMTVLVKILDDSKIYFAVDVNGHNKKPNKAGHDLFFFQLNNHVKLLPMGGEETDYYSVSNEYCSLVSTNEYNGLGCTVKAILDPSYFKNLF